MNILLLLISITALITSMITGSYFYQKLKNKTLRRHDFLAILISVSFLIFSILVFLSAVKGIVIKNLIVWLSALILIKTISLILILSNLQKNRNITYPISLILLSLIPAIIDSSNIHLIIPTSFLIIIMTFLSFSEDHRNHIYLLVVYASISLMFYILSFIFKDLIILFTAISLSLFLIFITEFLKYLKKKKPNYMRLNKKSNSPIIPFLRHLIFIIIITNFIFIGTVSIHELGHAISAQTSNCEETKIVYELSGLPHTEIRCSDTSQQNKWILLGIFMPLFIAILLMFGDGKSIKEISLEIIGFGLMISYKDYQALGLSKNFSILIFIAGAILTTLAIGLLVKSRTD